MEKIIILVVALCGSVVCSFAQDVITLKNGDEIQASVQEIGIDEVKYKKFDNSSGPNYTLKKSDIFMIKYANGDKDMFTNTAVPATTPVNTPKEAASLPAIQSQAELLSINHKLAVQNSLGVNLSKAEIRSIMAPVPEALGLYNKGRSQRVGGYVFAVVGLAFDAASLYYSLTSLSNIDNEDWDDAKHSKYLKNGLVFLGVGLGCLIGEVVCLNIGSKNIASSVRVYNNAISKQQRVSDMQLKFGVTQSGGLGLTLNF